MELHTTLSPPVDGDVDEEMLSELFSLLDDGSADGLVRACNLFLVGVPDHLAEAERAVTEGRLSDAGRVAHSLRGTSGAFGARSLFQLAEHLQMACERDEPGQAGSLIEAMHRAFTTFRPVLAARLATVAYR